MLATKQWITKANDRIDRPYGIFIDFRPRLKENILVDLLRLLSYKKLLDITTTNATTFTKDFSETEERSLDKLTVE